MGRMNWRMALFAGLVALVAGGVSAGSAQTVRPAVGKPLQSAQKLIQSRRFTEALGPIGEAEKVGGQSDYERVVIARMKGAALAGAGDAAGATNAFDTVLASGQLSKDEQLGVIETVAGAWFRAKDYRKAIQWLDRYEKQGGASRQVLDLLPQAHYLSGDHAAAARLAAARIAAVEAAGGRPTEEQLGLLAASLQKTGDATGYVRALESLVRLHPSPAYWKDLITRTANRPGFPRALELDTYRLMHATGTLDQARDYMEAAQLAVQSGLIGEAQGYVEEAYGKRIFGSGEPVQIERQARLKALVEKKRADDRSALAAMDASASQAAADTLFKAGMAHVAYGDAAKGLPMMEQALREGGLKSPNAARLHLAYAYHRVGRNDEARRTLGELQGSDATADLARLWRIVLGAGRSP